MTTTPGPTNMDQTNPSEFAEPVETDLTGVSLINTPMLNKGTAFTEEERDVFHLHGCLPPHVGTLDDQVARRLKGLRAQESDFERYSYLRDLQDTNETLFHALIAQIAVTLKVRLL